MTSSYCLNQKRIGPCFGSGPGVRPHFSLFRLPRNRGGRRADKAQCPDCSGRGVRIAPDEGRDLRHARASRRANKHLRAYALPTARTGQDLFVPGWFTRVPPVGKVASTSPAGALPLPAFKTPHECAPRNLDRDGRSIVTLQVKSRGISLPEYCLTVNDALSVVVPAQAGTQ